MNFIEYPKCSTCQKAKKHLISNGLNFNDRDIVNNRLNKDELASLYKKSGLPLKRFFNTSGLVYKKLNLKDKLPTLSIDEQLELLATDGMLVKRPILETEDKVYVGYKPAEYDNL